MEDNSKKIVNENGEEAEAKAAETAAVTDEELDGAVGGISIDELVPNCPTT